MSTISRRDFMKTAGVMTLAVAASAAMAGCSAEEIPASSSEPVKVDSNSVSIGDLSYTLNAKLYKVTDYDTQEGVSGNKAKDPVEVLYVLLSEDIGDNKKTPLVEYGVSHEFNTSGVDFFDSQAITLAKSVFGSPIKTSTALSTIDSKSGVNVTEINGIYYYCYCFIVKKDISGSFVTPKFEMVFMNDDAKTYTTITAPIPAATEIDQADYNKLIG